MPQDACASKYSESQCRECNWWPEDVGGTIRVPVKVVDVGESYNQSTCVLTSGLGNVGQIINDQVNQDREGRRLITDALLQTAKEVILVNNNCVQP